MKTYHKLVRDRIPEIIEADGKICVCETLTDEDYIHFLDQKLNEELSEYQEIKSLEELADLLEVILYKQVTLCVAGRPTQKRTCASPVSLGLCPKLKYPPLCGGIIIQ